MYSGYQVLLEQVYKELRKDEHKGWISKVQFIENTTVPVIKLECTLYSDSPDTPSKVPSYFKIPQQKDLKFPSIMKKPIKIDIT